MTAILHSQFGQRPIQDRGQIQLPSRVPESFLCLQQPVIIEQQLSHPRRSASREPRTGTRGQTPLRSTPAESDSHYRDRSMPRSGSCSRPSSSAHVPPNKILYTAEEVLGVGGQQRWMAELRSSGTNVKTPAKAAPIPPWNSSTVLRDSVSVSQWPFPERFHCHSSRQANLQAKQAGEYIPSSAAAFSQPAATPRAVSTPRTNQHPSHMARPRRLASSGDASSDQPRTSSPAMPSLSSPRRESLQAGHVSVSRALAGAPIPKTSRLPLHFSSAVEQGRGTLTTPREGRGTLTTPREGRGTLTTPRAAQAVLSGQVPTNAPTTYETSVLALSRIQRIKSARPRNNDFH